MVPFYGVIPRLYQQFNPMDRLFQIIDDDSPKTDLRPKPAKA
jgi:hypothetical protein